MLILTFLSTILSLFTCFLGYRTVIILTILILTLALFDSCYSFYQTFEHSLLTVQEYAWLTHGELNIPFSFHYDKLSLILTSMIIFITIMVIIYSQEYLATDKYLVKFTNYLCIFCFAMLLLVVNGNYLCIFVSWEMVGLVSYLLISFWSTRNEANKGAFKAVAVNRIGDIFFLLALALIWYQSKTFAIDYICLTTHTNMTLICTCLAIAACAKSAQIILHTWLPDAMEGPTPVSSLLHSATMVTAGVFLLLRSTAYFSPTVFYILSTIACLTTIIASFLGIKHFDLKRIIAYSTCSQIGLMTLACSFGNYLQALYHLIMHAFFKCLLFLSAGSIIHSLNDEQDIRKMGGLISYLPITFVSMFLASLSLMGLPSFSGFYSKDLLLEHSYFAGFTGILYYLLTSLAAFLTCYYSYRIIALVFFQTPRISPHTLHLIREPSPLMLVPMVLLLTASIFCGFFFSSYFVAPFTCYAISDNFNIIIDNSSLLESMTFPIDNLPSNLVLISLIFSIIAFSKKTVPYTVSYTRRHKYVLFSNFSFNLKFYFDVYYSFLSRLILLFAAQFHLLLDKGFLEYFGPTGLNKTIYNIKNEYKFLSSLFEILIIFLICLWII